MVLKMIDYLHLTAYQRCMNIYVFQLLTKGMCVHLATYQVTPFLKSAHILVSAPKQEKD